LVASTIYLPAPMLDIYRVFLHLSACDISGS
jgi:hypothetical protein